MKILSFTGQLGQNLMTSFDGFKGAITAMNTTGADHEDRKAMAVVSEQTADAIYALATAQVKAGGLKHIADYLFKRTSPDKSISIDSSEGAKYSCSVKQAPKTNKLIFDFNDPQFLKAGSAQHYLLKTAA